MTSRVLPPEEWPRLVGTELERVYPVLNPKTARVIVVEDGDQIVGCWSIFPVFHVECLWISPLHRATASVGRRLLRLMYQLARLAGAATVMTGATDDHVARLITKAQGVPVPPQFVLPIPKDGR